MANDAVSDKESNLSGYLANARASDCSRLKRLSRDFKLVPA